MANSCVEAYFKPIVPDIGGKIVSTEISPVKNYTPRFYEGDGRIKTYWAVMVTCQLDDASQAHKVHKFDIQLEFPKDSSDDTITTQSKEIIQRYIRSINDVALFQLSAFTARLEHSK